MSCLGLKKAINIEVINRAVEMFDLKQCFDGKDINLQAGLLNQHIMKIFSKSVPNMIESFTDVKIKNK